MEVLIGIVVVAVAALVIGGCKVAGKADSDADATGERLVLQMEAFIWPEWTEE